MSQNLLQVDGKYYDVTISSLTRGASVLDSDNSSKVKTGELVRDIIGTYYNYTIGIEPKANPEDYEELYDLLTSPTPSHDIVVPYNQTTLSFKAYVTEASDTLVRQDEEGSFWKGLRVQFDAIKPQRR